MHACVNAFRDALIPGPDTVQFIDYEYSNSNAAAFDVANHFSERCGLSLLPSDYGC
jgi:hypothetical protein